MGFKARRIDAQDLELEAIMAEVDRAVAEGYIDGEDLQWLHENAPQSHVFYHEDLAEMGPDFEENIELVRGIGARDVDDKIRYWRRVLTDLERDDEVALQETEDAKVDSEERWVEHG